LLREVETGDEAVAKMLEQLAKEAGCEWAKNGEIVEDEVPEPPTDPITKPGDLWVLGEHRLLCGDSTKAEDVGRLMGGGKASLCFTSPPYGAGNVAKLRDHYVKGAAKRESFYESHDDSPSGWRALMDGWWSAVRPFADFLIVNIQLLADNKRELLAWASERREELVDIVVWDKGHGAPQMQANVLSNAYEFVLMFGGNGSRAIPFANFHGTLQNIIRINPKGENENAGLHRAVMPIALPIWAIAELCKTAESVIEPFSGTGTTIIAAEQLSRRCYAIEISPAYVDVAVQRWEKLTSKKAEVQRGS
jgi:DNA modification methylase